MHRGGIDHLGFQVDTDEELRETRKHIGNAEIAALDHDEAKCCYANSDKYWITDPQGVAWETFHTLGSVPMYSRVHRSSEISLRFQVPNPITRQRSCAAE